MFANGSGWVSLTQSRVPSTSSSKKNAAAARRDACTYCSVRVISVCEEIATHLLRHIVEAHVLIRFRFISTGLQLSPDDRQCLDGVLAVTLPIVAGFGGCLALTLTLASGDTIVEHSDRARSVGMTLITLFQ